MDKKSDIAEKERISTKEHFAPWIALAVAISFMICIFAPIDIYFANKEDFWFSLWQMLPGIVVIFTVVLVMLLAIFLFLSRFKCSDYILTFILAIFVYFYIQGNYIPRNYGMLDGTVIDWSTYDTYAAASIIAILVCIIACIVICIFFKRHIQSIAKYTSIFILLMQLITVGTLIIQNFSYLKSKETYTVTDKNEFVLSKDNNIVVFVLDSFDANDMNYLLDCDYDKYAKPLQDFTYYSDTLGAYPSTKCALPYILTGVWYLNEEPYTDYLKRAYTDNVIYKTLHSNGYTLDMYTEAMMINRDESYSNVLKGNYVISDKVKFYSSIYKLVAFNYMPHQLKKYFEVDTATFSELKQTRGDHKAYTSNMIGYAKKLKEDGILATRKGKLFKLYYTDGVHTGYTFGEELIEDSTKTYTVYDEAAGNIVILDNYIKGLKAAGIYDNTTIVVMADHGHEGYNQSPLFMIKNANEHHDFAISKAPMSWEYLSDIWQQLANGNAADEDFINGCKPELGYRRYLYYDRENESDACLKEMLCDGVASKKESLRLSGREYYLGDKK